MTYCLILNASIIFKRTGLARLVNVVVAIGMGVTRGAVVWVKLALILVTLTNMVANLEGFTPLLMTIVSATVFFSAFKSVVKGVL